MKYSNFYGTGVALVTPFNEDLSVDYIGLKNLLASTAAKGVDYYVVHGTTGESVTTTPEEKAGILKFIKENNPNKLPIVYGLGGNNTMAVLEQMKLTEFEGVDAILSVSPAYNKPSQQGIIAHYEALADIAPKPIILYNVPGRTGSNLTADTTITLSKHKNIIGIKEASGNLNQCLAIASQTDDEFMLISGDDMLTLPLYTVGAKGVISVLANSFADIFKSIRDHHNNGEHQLAAKSASKLQNINSLMYLESNPVGVKEVLNQQGVCKAYVRLPLIKASESLRNKIDGILQKDGL